MGDEGDSSRPVNGSYPVGGQHMFLGHVGGFAAGEESVERLLELPDEPLLVQVPRHVGATQDPVGLGLELQAQGGDIDMQRFQPVENPQGTNVPRLLLAVEQIHQGRGPWIDEQAEHMQRHVTVGPATRQLDARNQLDAEFQAGGEAFLNPSQGIVVGQTKGGQAGLFGPGQQLPGGQESVGGGAVNVEIGKNAVIGHSLMIAHPRGAVQTAIAVEESRRLIGIRDQAELSRRAALSGRIPDDLPAESAQGADPDFWVGVWAAVADFDFPRDLRLYSCEQTPGRMPGQEVPLRRTVPSVAGVRWILSLTLAGFVGVFLVVCPALAEKNLLPRLPELVIEKGHSDSFEVVECSASSQVVGEVAQSSLKVILRNVSAKPVDSSLKIRTLYLLGEHGASMSVNGKPYRFDRRNPRLAFSLEPGQDLTVALETRQNILYNLDALKKEEEEDRRSRSPGKSVQNAFDGLKRFFGHDNFGRRFMVGPLVSKWGIFPVPFRQVRLQITIPRDFEGVLPAESAWKRIERGQSQVFTFEGTDGFSGAVFLPRQDVPAFKKLQEEAFPATSPARLAP